jgi:signal transduction histidine kinase
VSVTALKDRKGGLDGFVTIFHDLTELNRLEDLKSDFVSVVSHELRTPVTAIRGALSLHRAAGGDDQPASQQRLLRIAHANCDRLVKIVSDILDIDKLSRQKLRLDRTQESVDELIGQAIAQTEAFANQYSVTCRVHGKPSGLHLSLDAERFVQVMVNLLSNAAKFSHPQGEVIVSVRRETDFAVIRVVDYGIGIPESFQPHIFERFSQHASALTRKTGGTGLGLAITKMLVEAHGGTVSFTSEQGMGSTFVVAMPLTREAQEVPEYAQGGTR